jgi:hypothetical protein
MMNTQTILLAAVIITATVALAVAPLTLSTASADQPRKCFHKGTGDSIDCGDTHGSNSINCNPSGKNDCHD